MFLGAPGVLGGLQLARIVMHLPEVDPARVGATGGSQGGGLTLACAALEPRVKMLAPIFPLLTDYKRVWEIDQDTQAYEELRQYFRSGEDVVDFSVAPAYMTRMLC